MCNYCINSRFYRFIPFLSLMLCDISDTIYVSIKQCFNELLAVSDALKIRSNYRKFLSLYRQNKLIDKVKTLSAKGISNQYLNYYIISAALQLLLIDTSVGEMLPSQLESNSTLNSNLHFVWRNLHSISSYPYSFNQCDRKSMYPKSGNIGANFDRSITERL